MKFVLHILVCALSISSSATAQLINPGNLELGLNIGVSVYQGDLTPSAAGSYRTPGFYFSLFGNRVMSNSVLLRTNLAVGNLRGNDAAYSAPAWRPQRAFAFSSTMIELSEQAMLYPLGNDRKLTPYAFAGIGLTYLKTTRDYSRFNSEYFAGEPALVAGLAQDAARRPAQLIPVAPIGAGLQYQLNDRLALTAETGYRLTATDYIDGFSKAANPDLNDHYLHHAVGIKINFRKRANLDCPDIKKMR